VIEALLARGDADPEARAFLERELRRHRGDG
jgi:hypothetical protein